MYYFLSISGYGSIARKFAFLITTMQISQMIGGTVATALSAYFYSTGGHAECAVDPANFKMGLGMYGSYFILFSMLFKDKYFPTKGEKKKEEKEVCGVNVGEDGAGLFPNNPDATPDGDEKKTE
jgi:hypothetical protein